MFLNIQAISGLNGKEFACKAGALSSILGLGRSSGEEHGDQLQDSCLENPKDRRAWWAASMQSQSQTRLSAQAQYSTLYSRGLVTKSCPTLATHGL